MGTIRLVRILLWGILPEKWIKGERRRLGNKQQLKKELNFAAALALVVGMVIGSGIFIKAGKVVELAGNSNMALLAWAAGGIITLCAGLTIAELGACIPQTGGVYAYLENIYGKFPAFLFGWVQSVIYGPATIAALALYFAALFLPFFTLPDTWQKGVAMGVVLLLGSINCLGAKYGGYIQSAATVAKFVPILLIITFGLLQGENQVLGIPVGEKVGMGAAILATLWAYDGWVGVSYVAGEMKDPGKLLPRSIFVGLSIVITAYLAMNIALLHILPAQDMMALGTQAAGTAAGLLFGAFGGKLINIGILISIFGTLNGYILTNSRVPFAMAERGVIPLAAVLSRVHSSWGTPVYATLLELGLATTLILFWKPDSLTDIAMFIIWAFYILAFTAVFILRRRQQPGTAYSYQVPLYPVVPLVAIGGAGYIVISMFFDKPLDACWAVLWVAAGIPLFFFRKTVEK